MKRCVYTLMCIALGMLSPVFTNAQLNADFTSTTTTGCAPILVQFTDQSTGSPTSWSWNLGNGTTSTLQNPSTTYLIPGNYTVTLTVGNGSGTNTKTVTNYITVVQSPFVNFVSSDSTLACLPQTIQFTNLSVPGTAGAPSYLWDFGDGTTSTDPNPSHTYSAAGNFNVTLSLTNSAGCNEIVTKNQYVKIAAKPISLFTASNANSCSVPNMVSFANNSTGAVSYLWNFGDGSTSTAANPTHNYTAAGSYTVSLITTNTSGCKDTLITPGLVNVGSLSASFTKSTATTCTNNSVVFTNTSLPGPGVSTWYFGDGTSVVGTNATKAYTVPGTYTVKLKVVYGNNCADSTTQTVTVNPGPNTQFTANPTVGCSVPFTTQFSNTTTGATNYLWLFGDGTTSTSANPVKTYNTLGSYTVRLISYSANGCSDTLKRTNYIVIAQPTMTIVATPSSGCAPVTVAFTAVNSSTVPVTNYTWNFGDGTIVTGSANMTHTYSAPGTYDVTVQFTTAPGCTFTSAIKKIKTGTKPNASFTATPTTLCPNTTVTFTNTSTGPVGTTYFWIFGNGETSTQFSPATQYSTQGIYTVSLIATNNGCKDTFQTLITVHPPSADFTPVYSCTNRLKVTFTNASTGGNVYSWDFGDGTSSTAVNPVHIYSTYGTYDVILNVTNLASGCVATRERTITVFELDADFAADDTTLCKGQPVEFSAQFPTAIQPFIQSCSWYFGDGGSVLNTGTLATHAYSSPGVYTITLVVKDTRNCTDTFIRTNYIVVGGPIADFTASPTTGCAPLAVNFTDLTTTGGLATTGRLWRFGDGTNSNTNQANPSHIYTVGVYNVRLKVTDEFGCTDSVAKIQYIKVNKPVAAFSTPDTFRCAGQAASFVNSSTGGALTYSWNFGDGSNSSAAAPSHAYSNAGNYTVRLIVTDTLGCKDTLIRNAYIHVNNMNLGFTASDTFATCPPLTVNFSNTSSGTGNFNWSFGNGNVSTLTSPTTVFTQPGTYTVKLKGQNGAGCVDSVTKTITVLGPTGSFSYTPVSGCVPLTVQFSSVNSNTQQLIWDMNNGITQTTLGSTTTYTYTQSGKYVPKLLLSDGVSCIIPLQGLDTITVNEVETDFSFTSSSLCSSGTVQFSDTTIFSLLPITNRFWSFGDGGTSTIHNPSHFYSTPGTYTVTLIAGSAIGCNDTVVKTVTIFPAPNVGAGPGMSICEGSTTPVQLTATGASNYTWSPSGTLSCSNCPNPLALPTATTTYTFVGSAANGCTDTGQVTIVVNPLPSVATGPDPFICFGSSIQLAATGAATYNWSPAAGLSCTNCTNPIASPATTTTYVVTGTSAAGCTDTSHITVTAGNAPPVTATASSTGICAGGSVQLQAAGATTYSWTPATGLSCTNCDDPVATPTVTTTYTVAGTDGNGCTDTATVTITVNQLPAVSAGNDVDVCEGSSVQLSATGAVSYQWSPSGGLTCTTCPDPIASINATTTYTLTGTDANGCINTDQVTLTLAPLPLVDVTSDQTICEGSSVLLTASGAQSYSWSPATGLSCANCAAPTAAPLTTTTYTVVGGTAAGCTDTAVVTINVNSLPPVDAGPDQTICALTSAQLEATGAVSYSWTPSSGLSCTTCPDPVATPSGPVMYTVTGTDANGCTKSDNVQVGLHPQPVINAGADLTVCLNQSVQLSVTGGQQYTWSPSSYLSCTNCSDPVATPLQDITYTVTGTDANGCTDSDKITVAVIQMLPITIGPGDTLCEGESTQLNASGGDTYLWIPATGLDNNTSANPIATPAVTTNYYVVVKQGSCFTDTSRVTVVVHPKPTVNAGADHTMLAGSPVNLFANATHTTEYLWSPADDLSCFDCQSPVATPKRTTSYTVFVSNEYGCKAQDDVTVFVECDKSLLFLANTFTPNGDGHNDRFYPQGKGVSSVQRFRIYNRWGELIYDVQNITLNSEMNGWDGTYKGEQLRPDVFVYILDAICDTGEPMQVKGDISLIR